MYFGVNVLKEDTGEPKQLTSWLYMRIPGVLFQQMNWQTKRGFRKRTCIPWESTSILTLNFATVLSVRQHRSFVRHKAQQKIMHQHMLMALSVISM